MESSMCLTSSKLSPCSDLLYISFRSRKPSSRGHNLQYRRLRRKRSRSRQGKEKKEMEIKNMKLYLKNKSIIEENEKLKNKAYLLNQENQALLFQLQNKFPKSTAASQQQSNTITL